MKIHRKTVVITGGAGYLGTRVRTSLLQQNFHVISLDIYDTDHAVDLTNLESVKSVELPPDYLFIHLAFPLPGSLAKRKFISVVEKMNFNLVEVFKPHRTLLISSTAVYELESEEVNKVAPWEIYGRLKLSTEKLFKETFSDLVIFRPGTLIEQGRNSSMAKFMTQLIKSRFPLMPFRGDFIHPFTETDDLVSAIVSWAIGDIPKGTNIFNLIAKQPLTLRELANIHRMKKLYLPMPKTLLRLLGSDNAPFLGISKWHLSALTYNLKATNELNLKNISKTYSEIFKI